MTILAELSEALRPCLAAMRGGMANSFLAYSMCWEKASWNSGICTAITCSGNESPTTLFLLELHLTAVVLLHDDFIAWEFWSNGRRMKYTMPQQKLNSPDEGRPWYKQSFTVWEFMWTTWRATSVALLGY